MINGSKMSELLKEYLLQPERHERNILKMCEEMAELQEVLLKYVNKAPEYKPPVSKIVEELGDVFFRGYVLVEQFNIYNEVYDRCYEKTNQIHEYFKSKTEGNTNGS